MVTRFYKNQTLGDFQKLIDDIYGLPDDRLYSLWDLITQQQRFSMRALKGIRKEDKKQIRINILIALSWLAAIANRLHVNLEDEVWKRFPYKCSYCGKDPCVCQKIKPKKRKKLESNPTLKPENMQELQSMFESIYPSSSRTLADAGIHFAEEMGEVSEAILNYLGKHNNSLFQETRLELADYVSCAFGVANSANIDVSLELEKLYNKNCHVCHKAPCSCSFTAVANFKIKSN